jgi:hypothetical protein
MPNFIRKPTVLRNIGVDMKDFDWEIYLLNYPELVAKGIRTKNDACNHYKSSGYWEKRSSQIPPSFHAERYMKSYSHLGLKTPREAYIHFMKVGSIINKHEGFKRTSQPYRTPAASQHRRPIPVKTSTSSVVKPNNKPPTTIHPMPNPSLQRPRRVVQPAIVKHHVASIRQKQKPNNIIPSLLSMHHVKRNVRQAKPGELVLHEPPSSYFARLGVLGPPKYVN